MSFESDLNVRLSLAAKIGAEGSAWGDMRAVSSCQGVYCARCKVVPRTLIFWHHEDLRAA